MTSPDSGRRQQLIRIAFDHIATKGFEGLRFQEVAAEAAINNATLYHYFPSKEALIQGLVDWLMEQLKEPPAAADPPAGTALDDLRRMFEGVGKRVTKDTQFFIVITELALRARRDPAIDKIGRQRDDFFRRRIFGILERGIAEGSFRSNINLDTAADALMAQIKGIAHHAAMRKRKRGEVDRVASEIAAQVEHWLTCPAL